MKKTHLALVTLLLFMVATPLARADAIHLAARRGDLESVKAILKLDPGQLEKKDIQGWTPLHHAARGGHLETCKYLLDQGADVNADGVGGTPLHLASTPEVARLLIKRGAKLDARESAVGDTALHSQALLGRVEVCRVLLDAGADVNARDNLGSTPLHHASTAGKIEVMKLLLDRGAFVNARDDQGWTPLHWAAGLDRKEAVRLLVKRGADVNARDNVYSATPLHWAAGLGKKNMVKLLLELGADPTIPNKDGKDPARIARDFGYPEIERIIEAKQAQCDRP